MSASLTGWTGIKRPCYVGNCDSIIEILAGEMAITRTTDPKPVIAIPGLGPCVSLIGYEPEQKYAFATHYHAWTSLSDSYGILLYNLSKYLPTKPANFEVGIIGGWDNEPSSKEIIDFFNRQLNVRKDISMNLIEEDTGGDMAVRNIAIDSRNGIKYDYDRNINPYRRGYDESQKEQLSLIPNHRAELIYRPQTLDANITYL